MTGVAEETVPAVGTTRRLQALAVAGWPTSRMSRETGLPPYRLMPMLTGAAKAVTREEARLVAAVYDRFSTASPGLCGVSHMAA
uniref:hypothetical protein n=1 Tax=Streptomyces sp. cmx-10-25 TaxID=2790919 RepID=UPI00397F768C